MPNLTAPAPRFSDGKLELSGVWQTEPVPPSESALGENFSFVVPGDDSRTFNKHTCGPQTTAGEQFEVRSAGTKHRYVRPEAIAANG
jgi:hypothetical protein